MNILRVGIAGFGIVGQKRKLFIDQNPNLKVVSLADIRFKDDLSMKNNESLNYNYSDLEKDSQEISGNFETEIKYYRDYRNMIKKGDIDILFVCLPNYKAADATIFGLENGCNVFCEKPPAKNLTEVKDIVLCSKKNSNLKLKYGFNHRYHRSVQKAHDIINKKKYGDIMGFRGVYGKSSIIPFGHGWRSNKEFAGGGILLDQGIHLLDLVRYFSGDYDEIHSFIDNKFWNHDVEDNAFILMRNKKGQVASLHSTATQWQHRFRLEIILEEAMLELSGILTGSKSYGSEKLKIIERVKGNSVGSQEEKIYTFLDDDSWKLEIDEFAECVFNNKEVSNGTIDEALKVMEMIYKIYESDSKWISKEN